jgi:hypothetical protein
MKTNIYITKLGFSLLILTLMSSILKAEIHQPQLQIPLIETPPVIDGKLTDASWDRSTELSEFVKWSRDSYIKDPVTLFLCYDEKNLYIAFRNNDPKAGELNTTVNPKGPRDTFLWGRNHARVGIRYKDNYIQLMADPKGTMTDWKNNDIKWNGDWKYEASINQSDWTAEFTIPLSDLGLNGTVATEELDLSLSRSFPHGESSSWSGKCNLSSETTSRCIYGEWPKPVPGKNQLSFSAQNYGDEVLILQCELELIPLNSKPEFINQTGQGPTSDFQLSVSSEPIYYRSDFSIPAGGTIKENIGFNLPVEGSYFGSATVKSEDGTIIRRSVDYWFSIEPNNKKLEFLKERIGESIASMTRLSNPLVMNFQAEAEMIYSEIQDLESYSDTAWESGKWEDLTARVEKTDLRVARHLHEVRWAALHHWQRRDDFGIAIIHSILKLRKDDLFPVPLRDNFELSLARNEYESFQLAILPFGKEIKQLSLEVSDLTGKNGNIIQKDNIEVSWVDYNKIDWQSDYVANQRGWHPDPLIPFKNGINIGGEDVCRPLWITVYAPAGTKAGEYEGTIQVSAEGMQKVTANVKCRVWDFDLPVVSHLKTHSWDQIEYLQDFYNLEEYPIEWYQQFCELLLKNRFNPGSAGVNYVSQTPDSSGEYDFSDVEQVLSYCIERGLTRFSMIQMKKGIYTPEEAEEAYAFVEAYVKFLRQKGWLDKALVELWDEPTDLEWPYIKARAEKLKQIDPELRLQLFAEGGPYDFWDKNTDRYGLNNLVDIWAPVNIVESPETQANGGEIWTYFCTLARESAPNFYIDCPAIYQRSIAWYCWMYGVDGFEHWSTNYFWRNVHKGKLMHNKWPNVPWDSRTYYYFNGEGQLIYPGPDGIPYSSIRLENFRDGMDDYEYLFRLRELLSSIDSNSTDPELNEFRQLLYPENYLLYKYPRKIKLTLENTIRYPDQPERILDTREKIAMAIEKLQKR